MILTLLIALLAAAGWAAIFAALGARVRCRARVPMTPSLRLPLDFLTGAWIVGSLCLVLGLVGLFRPAALLALTAAAAAMGRWRGHGWNLRVLLPLLIPVALLAPVAFAAPFFYDAQVYHLGLPWQALLDGRVTQHPESLFAAFPPLAQLVYAGPLAAGITRAPALLHLIGFGLLASTVSAMARRLGATGPVALLAGATLLLLPSLAWVPSLPAADGWAAAATIVGLALAIERPPRPGHALLCGMLGGIATAFRLQGLPWTLILIAIVAAQSDRRVRDAALATTGWILGSWPWWLKNLILSGEPLAPMGWRGEGMEIAWRDSSSNLYLVDGPADWLPSLWNALAPHQAYAGPLLLAASFAIAIQRNRKVALLAAAIVLGVGAWWATGSLPRYIAPTAAVLLVLAAGSSANRAGRWVATLAMLTALALGLVFNGQQMARWGGPGLMVSTPNSWPEGLVTFNPAPAFEAARVLPEDARVLFVGEARGLGFPRRFVAPSPYDVSPLTEPLQAAASLDAAVQWLRDEGFTHVLINFPELSRLAKRHPVEPWRNPEGQARFRSLVQSLAPPVVVENDVAIFAVPQ